VTETSRTVGTDPVVGVSRRVALGAAACSVLAFAAACGGGGPGGSAGNGARATTTPADTDIRLLTNAIAAEESFVGFCAAALHRFPEQRPLLAGLVERQRMHITRFRVALENVTPRVNHSRPPLPRRSRDLLPAVGDLALEARNMLSADCLTATSGLLAELLASVAASHGVTVLLTEPQAAATTVSVPDSVSSGQVLQPCLAAEHAAVFGYGLLGGVLSAAVSETPSAKAARASYDAHRERRDTLTQLIATAGGEPVAAEPAYATPFPVAGVPSARRMARYLEARCATVYARATAVTTLETRVMASGTLLDCAVRGARWGSAPTAFPGLDQT
jgi:hypothetical protein